MKIRALILLSLPCVFALAQRPAHPSSEPRGGGGPVGGAGAESAISDRQIGGVISISGNDGPRDPGNGGTNAGGIKLMPPRPGGAPKITRVEYFVPKSGPKRKVVMPPVMPTATEAPTTKFWAHRDIQAEIQWLSRVGFLPVIPVDASAESVVDHTHHPSGWKAYGIAVPPGGRLQVELQHSKIGWFRLSALDKWGQLGPGTLQATLAYKPVLLTVSNPKKEAEAIYVIVDDPGRWSIKDPYKLVVRRDWDPAVVNLSSVQMAVGLWGGAPTSFVASAEFR